MVACSIGKYSDEMACEVVHVQASHLLLGRPWQFDRCILHDGYKSKYFFEHNGHKFTLAPLLPKKVSLDQVKLQQSSLGKLGSKIKEKQERKEAMKEKNKEKGLMANDKKGKNMKSEKKEISEKQEKTENMKTMNREK